MTTAGTKHKETMSAACIAEINSFVRGGTPGLDRLRAVLPSVFRYYNVTSKQAQVQILIQCKLFPTQNGKHVSFEFKPATGNCLGPE